MPPVNLTIIIPTLNRPTAVVANVRSLISSCGECEGVVIYVSENCSDRHLCIDNDAWTELVEFGKKNNIEIRLMRRKERIPMGPHFALLSQEVKTSWQLWMGDDDCLAGDYVSELLAAISLKGESENLKAVFSRFFTCSDTDFFLYCKDFRKIRPRSLAPLFLHDIKRIKGFINRIRALCRITLRGNQLSGLCFHKSVIQEVSARINPLNLYPFITWMGQAAATGSVLEVPEMSIAVTSNTQKHFSYGRDGLQPDIIEAVRTVRTGSIFLDMSLTCMAAASERVLWRMNRTSPSRWGAIWNYIRLFSNLRIPKAAWICGMLRLLVFQIRKAWS